MKTAPGPMQCNRAGGCFNCGKVIANKERILCKQYKKIVIIYKIYMNKL